MEEGGAPMRKGWLLLLFLLVFLPQPAFAESALDNMLPDHSPANDPEDRKSVV